MRGALLKEMSQLFLPAVWPKAEQLWWVWKEYRCIRLELLDKLVTAEEGLKEQGVPAL